MNKPRNIPFGQMTTVECMQCLVQGHMPNGTIIDHETAKASLSRLLPMVKDSLHLDYLIGTDWINAHPNDPFVLHIYDMEELIAQAEKILDSK
jgi:hypothetical protein